MLLVGRQLRDEIQSAANLEGTGRIVIFVFDPRFTANPLVEQPSVSDNKKTVKQVLAEAGIEVTRFVHFEVGQA